MKVIVPKDIDPVGKIKRYTDWKVCQSSVKYTCEVDFILVKDRGGFVLQKTPEKEKTIAEWLNKKFDQKFIHGDKTTPDKTVTKPVNENDSIDKSLLFPSHRPSPFSNEELTKEEEVLSEHINYYLISLGLKPFNFEELAVEYGDLPLARMAYIGDAMLLAQVREVESCGRLAQALVTNQSLQLALYRIGFDEWLGADVHLAGSAYEVLICAAIKQNNQAALSLLLQGLLGNRYSSK